METAVRGKTANLNYLPALQEAHVYKSIQGYPLQRVLD